MNSNTNQAPASVEAGQLGWAPRGIGQAWTNFWFTPVAPVGLHALRVLAGLLFLFWLLTLAGHYQALFGLNGWLDREGYRESARHSEDLKREVAAVNPALRGPILEVRRQAEKPPEPVAWSLFYLTGPSEFLVHALYWGSVLVLVLFTLGIATRLMAVLTFVVVGSFLANPAARYEVDYLLVILALYLMIGYVFLGLWGRKLSPAEKILGPRDSWIGSLFGGAGRDKSYAANLAVRLLQVHFALVVVVSALHKLQMGDWWAGNAFWYPLHPPLETTAQTIKDEAANAPTLLFFLGVAEYLVLAWQLAFPFFAWRRRWRLVLLGGAAVGWLGLAFLYRLPLFGPVLVLGCLSYLTTDEWLGLIARLSEGAQWVAGRFRAAPAKKLLGQRS